ncbi:hypothetical protein, partial [Weissella confusa]|uniref:hypothetical protein n=1 Tax=Weissella confusa TaxID=1583 RepID=UPI00117C64EB
MNALAKQASDLSNAVTSLVDKTTQSENAAREAAKLHGQTSSNEVANSGKQFSNTVVQDKAKLDDLMNNDASTADEINKATAVLLGDEASELVIHTSDQTVMALQKEMTTLVQTGTTVQITELTTKLKVADSTVIPSTLSDDPALKTAKQAIDDAIQGDKFDQDTLDAADKAYKKAVEDAEGALATAKEDAGKTVVKHGDDANVTKMKAAVDAAIANGTKTAIATAVSNMKVADDTAEVPSTLSDDPALKTAKQAIDDAIQGDK